MKGKTESNRKIVCECELVCVAHIVVFSLLMRYSVDDDAMPVCSFIFASKCFSHVYVGAVAAVVTACVCHPRPNAMKIQLHSLAVCATLYSPENEPFFQHENECT